MSIILIIFGAIIFLVCGILYLSTHTAIKNQKNWDSFYKTVEENNLPASEETIYNLVCKINLWSSIGAILGLVMVASGIILQLTIK